MLTYILKTQFNVEIFGWNPCNEFNFLTFN